MELTFNETHFLASVKRMSLLCPGLSNEQTAKNFIRSAIMHCGYNQSVMFPYFSTLLETHIPDLRNRRFDVAGWKRIYTRFIDDKKHPAFAEQLKQGLTMATTADELELCFITAADSAGYKGALLLLEIRLDSIGWTTVVKTLVQVADEKGIEVPAMPVVEKKSRGRKRKEVAATTDIETPVAGAVKKKEKPATTKRNYNRPVVRFFLDGMLLVDNEPFKSVSDAARRTGINHSNITSCLKGRGRSAGGYVWRYWDEVPVSEIPESPAPMGIEEPTVPSEPAPDAAKQKLEASRKEVGRMVVAYYTDEGKKIDTSRPPIGTYASQQEAADKLGVNKATISNYFRGIKRSVRWTREDGEKFWIGFRKDAA